MGILKLSDRNHEKPSRWSMLRLTKGESTEESERLGPVMAALKMVHSAATHDESMNPEDLERQRSGQELLAKLIAPMQGMDWDEFDLQRIPAAWARPQKPHDLKQVVLYCHGGGYTCGELNVARVLSTRLSSVLNCDALSFAYRLAPEYPCPAAIEDAITAWDHLMYLGYGANQVIVAGDSAGGNLALELVFALKAQKRRLPKALVLFSPWTDMTCAGRSHQQNIAIDPIITPEYIHSVRRAYGGGRCDWEHPMLSPLFGDFTDFPPTLIQAGTNEILLSDSELLHNKMRSYDCTVQLEIYPEAWHVFQMYPSRKAAQALEAAAQFIFRL